MYHYTILFLLSLTCLHPLTSAHSHLGHPRPTRRLDCRIGNGRIRPCPGPCPLLDSFGDPSGISPSRPAVTWRRGDTRVVTWHRNNHGTGSSGFVRFSMVPVDKLMDKALHDKYTFQISCWGAGLHNCPSRAIHVCGNDVEGKALQVQITVPTIYPDGVYAFGWAWYGGGDFRDRSFFGDYYSCSFVRIQGGAAVTAEWTPRFVAGRGAPYSDSCMSATNKLGVCPKEPCHVGNVKRMKPGHLPTSIDAWELREGQCDANGNGQPFCDTLNNNNNNIQARVPPQANQGQDSVSFDVQGMNIYSVLNGRSHAVGYRFNLRASAYPNGFTLGLRVSGRVTRVTFSVGQAWKHTEHEAPYIMNGNDGGRLFKLDFCRKPQTVIIDVTVSGIRSDKDYRFEMRCL